MTDSVKSSFISLYEGLELIFTDNDVIKSLELYNFNDDYVVYCSVYIISAVCLFILCILTNFYRIRPKYVLQSSNETKAADNLNKETNFKDH
jgi:hypothetical protein